MNEPTVADLERELASFAAENARQRVPIPLPPVPVVTTETVELKGEGEMSPPAEIPMSPPPGGGGISETVTGAVNGVPATLNVLTDGAGWVAI